MFWLCCIFERPFFSSSNGPQNDWTDPIYHLQIQNEIFESNKPPWKNHSMFTLDEMKCAVSALRLRQMLVV